jgi:transposase
LALKVNLGYGLCPSPRLRQLANHYKKGKATIERWYHKHYQEQHQERSNQACPRILGIDEHFFNRKQGFATTLCDLRHHKIFDIAMGHKASEL